MPVDGEVANTRWVVYAADGAYQVGKFDGKTFTPDESEKQRFNWGNCFYASQTYSNVPPEDGRRIQIAWGQIGHPEMPFNQQMNFPVELTLRTTDEGVRLFANPVKEVSLLHSKSFKLEKLPLSLDANPLAGKGGELLHIQADDRSGRCQANCARRAGREDCIRCRRTHVELPGQAGAVAVG